MPTVSITWHTLKDGHPICPICKAIDGYTWTFDGEVPDSLVHPQYGEIWNVTLGSLAHEIQQHRGSKYGLMAQCKCNVEPKIISLKDLADAVRELKNKLKEQLGEEITVDDTKSGGSRRTTFEDIGIDPSKYGFE
jgi:hypothetical protein